MIYFLGTGKEMLEIFDKITRPLGFNVDIDHEYPRGSFRAGIYTTEWKENTLLIQVGANISRELYQLHSYTCTRDTSRPAIGTTQVPRYSAQDQRAGRHAETNRGAGIP